MGTPERPQLACGTNFLRVQERNATGYVAWTTDMHCLTELEAQGQGVGPACPSEGLLQASSSPLSYLCPDVPLLCGHESHWIRASPCTGRGGAHLT